MGSAATIARAKSFANQRGTDRLDRRFSVSAPLSAFVGEANALRSHVIAFRFKVCAASLLDLSDGVSAGQTGLFLELRHDFVQIGDEEVRLLYVHIQPRDDRVWPIGKLPLVNLDPAIIRLGRKGTSPAEKLL